MTSASDPAGGPRLLHVYSGNLYGGVERLLETLHAGGPAAGLRQDFALCFEGRVGERLREAGAPLIDLGPVRRRAGRPGRAAGGVGAVPPDAVGSAMDGLPTAAAA